jgi:aminocarboxymuconate-semialdehyde decarboxylase
MTSVDIHTHWFPPCYYELLASRTEEPRAERDGDDWNYLNGARSEPGMVREWFDLDMQFETAARTGMEMALVSSMGIHSDLDGLPAGEAREAARMVNEEWAAAQRRHPGRFFAAAAVPLQDTEMAIEELDHAITALDLRAVSIPSSVACEPLDTPRLAPFWARVEQLGVPLFIHPTDGTLLDVLDGYDKRLHGSLGRVVDSSVAVLRLVLSGTLDRHPDLKILHFHAGGVLPYAAGRLDKNASSADLVDQHPTTYLKRMWVDTAMPYPPTIAMALEFYGADRVLYGSDNPCWNPMAALEATRSLNLEATAMSAVLEGNARGLLDLRVPTSTAAGG